MSQLPTSFSAVEDRKQRDAVIRDRLIAFRDVLDTNMREVAALNDADSTGIARVAYLDCEQVDSILTAILNDDVYNEHEAALDRKGVCQRHESVSRGKATPSLVVLEYAWDNKVASTAPIKDAPTTKIDSDPVALGDVAIRHVSARDGVEYLKSVENGKNTWTGEISHAMRFESAWYADDFAWRTWGDYPPTYTLEAMLPIEVYAIHNDSDWNYAIQLYPDWSTVRTMGCDEPNFHLCDIVEVIAAQKKCDPQHGQCYGLRGVFRLKGGEFVYVNATLGGCKMDEEHDWLRIYFAESMMTMHSHIINQLDVEALRLPYSWATSTVSDAETLSDDVNWSAVFTIIADGIASFSYHGQECPTNSFGIDDVRHIVASDVQFVDGGHERDSSNDHTVLHGLFMLKDDRWLLVVAHSGSHDSWEHGNVHVDVCDSRFTATSHRVMGMEVRAVLKFPPCTE